MDQKIGLIAGLGEMPLILGRELVKIGRRLVVVDLIQAPKERWKGISERTACFEVGQISKIISFLHKERIKEIVMIGKVAKQILFKDIKLDEMSKKILANLRERSDEAIMSGIIQEFEENGIVVAKQTKYLWQLLPKKGVLTESSLNKTESLDIEYGMRMAKEIAKLNIGQMVVVKNRTVLAVEAIEGTDETILRGGKLGGEGVVVAKVSKPDQDQRFDIPTVGLATIETMRRAGAKVLSIEADRVFLVNEEEVIQRANEYRIAITVNNNKSHLRCQEI